MRLEQSSKENCASPRNSSVNQSIYSAAISPTWMFFKPMIEGGTILSKCV